MVATTDCMEDSRPVAGKKVSKPVMEKKRRARINKCLDQLKSLLENYYSTSIRKRKLEKADILELTVNHLRSLQKIQTCTALAFDTPNFQSGFRRCLTNVNQFLVDDNLNGSERWMLSQLSRKLWRSRGEEEAFSTTDSYPERAEAAEEAQRLASSVASSVDGHTAKSEALTSTNVQQHQSQKSENACKRTERVHPKNSSHKNFNSVGHGNEAAIILAQNMWRPW